MGDQYGQIECGYVFSSNGYRTLSFALQALRVPAAKRTNPRIQESLALCRCPNKHHRMEYHHAYAVCSLSLSCFSRRGHQRTRLRSSDHLPTTSAYTSNDVDSPLQPCGAAAVSPGHFEPLIGVLGERSSTEQLGRLSTVLVSFSLHNCCCARLLWMVVHWLTGALHASMPVATNSAQP